jgi:hypothetical protein
MNDDEADQGQAQRDPSDDKGDGCFTHGILPWKKMRREKTWRGASKLRGAAGGCVLNNMYASFHDTLISRLFLTRG